MFRSSSSSTTHFLVRIALLSVLTALLFSCGGASQEVASTSAERDGRLYMRTMSWAGGVLEISWYYVLNDRIVVNPVAGVDPPDVDVEVERNGRNVATYRSSGDGTMSVEWGDGRKQNVRVETRDGYLSAFDGGLMTVAKPFDGTQFEDMTYTGLASVAQVSRTVTLFFGSDGRFRMQRLGSVTGGPATSGVGVDAQADEGTYTYGGNTLHFRFNDGREWIAVGQPYDLGNGEIIIGDQLFKKQR
jgi:hypothetical protein